MEMDRNSQVEAAGKKAEHHGKSEKEIVVQSGEGYYQAIHRTFPSMSNSEISSTIKQMRTENGNKNVLHAGEHLHLPGFSLTHEKPSSGNLAKVEQSAKHADTINKATESKASEGKTAEGKATQSRASVETDPQRLAEQKRDEAVKEALVASIHDLQEKGGKAIAPISRGLENAGKTINEKVGEANKIVGGKLNEAGKTAKGLIDAGVHEIDKDGKIVSRVAEEAVKSVQHNTDEVAKNVKKRADEVAREVVSVLTPEQETLAAIRKAYQAQKRVEEEHSRRQLNDALHASIKLGEIGRDLNKTFNSCKQFVGSVTDFIKTAARI